MCLAETISNYRHLVSMNSSHIKLFGKEVVPTDSGETFPDPDDKVFFCTALAGASNLVTGNMRHYPKADFVVTPAQFCELAGI